jgi:hypothetical protein
MTVEAMTGYTATIISPGVESLVFSDRSYTFDNLGSFTGHSYVHMSNEDKHTHNTHVQMKLRFDAPTVVYIVKLDTHPLPWLASEGWVKSSLTGVSYSGIHQTRHTEWDEELLTENHYGSGEVYEKVFPAGAVELRGNNGGDGSYLIFVANPAHTPTPPVVDLWRPVLGSENGERVKCNNNVDMVYVADQTACQMLAIANGHPFYSFRHNGQGAGHKCMSSAHCDDHLTERTNEWHIYSSAPPEPVVTDTPGWNNNHGYTCGQYAANGWCANGRFSSGQEWTGQAGFTSSTCVGHGNANCGIVYNFPGENCVACGKGSSTPPAVTDTPGWNNNHGYTCGQYAANGWCSNGAFTPGLEWTGQAGFTSSTCVGHGNANCGIVYNFPGQNCVVCGKGA